MVAWGFIWGKKIGVSVSFFFFLGEKSERVRDKNLDLGLGSEYAPETQREM